MDACVWVCGCVCVVVRLVLHPHRFINPHHTNHKRRPENEQGKPLSESLGTLPSHQQAAQQQQQQGGAKRRKGACTYLSVLCVRVCVCLPYTHRPTALIPKYPNTNQYSGRIHALGVNGGGGKGRDAADGGGAEPAGGPTGAF